MTEKWKHIPGYRDFYEVSNLGRIRRLKVRGRWSPTYKVNNRILKLSKSRYGYMLTRLISPTGRYNFVRVHRIVALAFIGPPPKDKKEINHLNGIKTDNRVENLVWASRTDNALHSTRVLGKGRGESHPFAKLTDDTVRQIRAEYVPRVTTYKMLARKYGVSVTTVLHVVQGKVWGHVT